MNTVHALRHGEITPSFSSEQQNSKKKHIYVTVEEYKQIKKNNKVK